MYTSVGISWIRGWSSSALGILQAAVEAAEEVEVELSWSVLLSLSRHCSLQSNCLMLVLQLGVLCLNVGGLQ